MHGSLFGGIDVPALTLAQDEAARLGLWPLFKQSFDVFTIALLIGSLVAVAWIVRVVLDIRVATIQPRSSSNALDAAVAKEDLRAIERAVSDDAAFASRVVAAALGQRRLGPQAMRDAAELAAGIESGRWFRRLDLLNIIGNLGPLVGLAGTVWGMILAFTSLGATGGQAGPTDLSLGISKALFHTLLGLLLAVPCLLVFGVYRGIADRICTAAMKRASAAVETVIHLASREERST